MKRPDVRLINTVNFWRKVDRRGPDECWSWLGAKVKNSYGTFTVGNRTFNASHVALTLDGRERPDPPRHVACHGDCSDPGCVNPAHLRWGTQKENIADVHRLGHQAPRHGENSGHARITEDDVRAIRASPLTNKALAKAYALTASNVSAIRLRRSWKLVT